VTVWATCGGENEQMMIWVPPDITPQLRPMAVEMPRRWTNQQLSVKRWNLHTSLRNSRQDLDLSSLSAPAATLPLWKRLKLPGKVRIIIRRLCHNILPTLMNTVHLMCNRYDEDGGHLFLKCQKVQLVWHSLLLEDKWLSLLSAPDPLIYDGIGMGFAKGETAAGYYSAMGLAVSEK
jgi:hypothetical protein